MKFLRYFLLFTFILHFSFLYCSGQSEEKVKELGDYVTDDNTTLREYFKNEKFDEMARLLGKRGAVLIKPNYQGISGKDSAGFWGKVWNENADLEFSTLNVYESDALGTVETTINGERAKVDKVAIVVQQIRIITREEGSILKNKKVNSISSYRHRVECPWL